MPDVRCGLIGYGAWGQHHARAIACAPDAVLSAICARSAQSQEAAQTDHPHARVYADHREMLASEDLDLCDVVLPSDLHFPIAKDVLESNRHLLLEKPMALNVADCAHLVDLARTKNRLLAIGHELRLSSLWGRVKQLIDSGAIGQPRYAMIELWRKPYRQGSGGWRYDISRVGSWILEEPIHFFDLARWYFSQLGNPTGIYAAASSAQSDHPELHDNFSAILHFSDSAYAVVSQTLCAWEHHQTAKITGTEGAIWASWSGAMDRTFEPTFSLNLQLKGHLQEIPLAQPSGEVYELVDEVAAVIRSVRDGTPLPCAGEDGLWSVAMCLAAQESLKTRQPVLLPESRP